MEVNLQHIVSVTAIPLIIAGVSSVIIFLNRRRPTFVVVFLLNFLTICFAGLFTWALIYGNLLYATSVWMLPLIVLILVVLVSLVYWDISKRTDTERQQSITMVSHNFLTPLSRIKYAIGTLKNEASTLPLDQQKSIENLAQHMLHDTDRLIHGTTLILEFSDLANRTDNTHFGQTDVSQILDELTESFRPSMLAKNLDFKVEKPNGPIPQVFISKFYLKTVLEVLLDNAETYTPLGGSITVRIIQDNKYLTFSVIDTGIGLTKENSKHIFERSYVPSNSAAIKDSGMGLGLSVAKDIIERNNGEIWVTSEGQGKGCNFSFKLKYHKA